MCIFMYRYIPKIFIGIFILFKFFSVFLMKRKTMMSSDCNEGCANVTGPQLMLCDW